MSKLLDHVRSTMKSQDTEGRFELLFTRTPGYLWACFFRALHIHPIAVTLASIVLGAGSAFFFVRTDLTSNIIAVALLVIANWFDCADGQLARMTGKKTLIGRILDGFAGDVWFQFIYVALAIRLTPTWGIWGWILGAYAGYWCHVRQANLADYYRNIHLYFLLGPTRSELDRSHLLQQHYNALRWRSSAWFEKLYLFFYIRYTLRQEHMTPTCQRLFFYLFPSAPLSKSSSSSSIAQAPSASADQATSNPSTDISTTSPPAPNIPPALRTEFLAASRPMMPACQALTFDLRIAVLYITALFNVVWLYFLFEGIVLQIIFLRLRHRHERLCAGLIARYFCGTGPISTQATLCTSQAVPATSSSTTTMSSPTNEVRPPSQP